MEVIFSIIYHYLSIISNLGFHHSLKYYHFQSYVYMRVYASAYLNYKFPGFHTSPLEVVSLTISHSAPTQFSLTFSRSTGAASMSISTRHLWKVFKWWFLSRQWTSFRWLFLSQQGLGALKNPLVTFGTCFVDDFPVATDSVFVAFFWVNRGCEHFRIHASPFEGF